jgi:S-DNA-T family DNA segregation ATPase FtsK/SpoIIIE
MRESESDALPVRAEPVLDGELVDDTLPQPRRREPQKNRFVLWWLRSPRVPLWLKQRDQARQAAKDLVVAVLKSPIRSIGAVVRGIVAAARWWRRWVTVRDYRNAAEQAEKLADKFGDIRALTLFRWKVTGAVAVVFALLVALAHLVYGVEALWIIGGGLAAARGQPTRLPSAAARAVGGGLGHHAGDVPAEPRDRRPQRRHRQVTATFWR